MIRIAICDDEKNIRTYLSSLVRKQNIECEITEYASTDEHLSDQKEHDLLFLDIEMKKRCVRYGWYEHGKSRSGQRSLQSSQLLYLLQAMKNMSMMLLM